MELQPAGGFLSAERCEQERRGCGIVWRGVEVERAFWRGLNKASGRAVASLSTTCTARVEEQLREERRGEELMISSSF